MRVKQGIAAVTIAGALTFTGAGMAQATPTQQNAGAVAGLIAAAVNVDDVVDIDSIRILTNDGEINVPINIEVKNNRVLTGLTIEALNNNDIRIFDVVDVSVDDTLNDLVVVVDVL